MQLVKKQNRYVAITEYSERAIPKSAGFRWDPSQKVWWTSEIDKAIHLSASPHCKSAPSLRAELKNALQVAEDSLKASRATDAKVDIPSPRGLEYLPFQKAGIKYAMQRPATLIGDEMGLGKTVQVCGLINQTQPESVLIICPASLKVNWQRELERWLVNDYTIGIASGKELPDTQIVIINYDILNKYRTILGRRRWDLSVADEAHYIKNPKAKRSKLVVHIMQQSGRRVLLTGTPIVNRPAELFNLLQLLDPDRWDNFFKYAQRYCAAYQGQWGWDFSGSSNLGELQNILRRTVMVRRLKEDVLTDLPAKRRQVIPIPLNGYSEQVRKEKDLEDQYADEIAQAQNDMAQADIAEDKKAYQAAVAKLRDLTKVQFTEMSEVRHETALLKVKDVISHVKDLMDSVDKVVVMAHHHDVIDELEAGLSEFNPVSLTGRDNQTHRQNAVDRFQTDPKCRLFIGSIQASGVGITLTAASTVVFAELDWVAGNLSQAEDRCHRIGQTDSVLVQHIVIDGSIDARMAQTVIAKQKVSDRALDENSEYKLPDLAEPIEPKKSVEVPEISPEHIQLIHEGLIHLASYDPDAASIRNNVGFNRVDGQFGHSLAAKASLTPKQAFYGRRLIRKYHRQLPNHIKVVLDLDKEN